MKGDFSHWRFDPTENFSGVLQQQGRVLLDRDWNEQARIALHWQEQGGADIIGAGLAAVPVDAPDGFKVVQALVTGTSPNQRVELQVLPGRIWADGLLCYLPADPAAPSAPVLRVADYLQPPIDLTPGSPATIDPGTRDIVVLEVSREELSAFQVPDRLLEPALGGPDTTERAQLRIAFKLYRAAAGETCMSIIDTLKDDPSEKGHLTVQLQPTVTPPSECPVVLGGGYSGFEHFLYRVEIAALNAAQPPSFKWSQFNGGLVGRGQLITTPSNRMVIRANHSAIVNSGLSKFYCEVLTLDEDRGVWLPTFGADVTLAGGDLVIGTIRLGAFSATTDTVFFRLWNGIEPIASFDQPTPKELLDGIQFKFDPPTASNYTAGDYWTFTVRAGEVTNSDLIFENQIAFGPVYHRVPVAEIDWGASGAPVVPPELEDCRRRFRPLTRLDTCCTVRVGDGETSLGDYESIQTAIDSLPAEGGMVCILPGVYHEDIVLENRINVTLSGCGPRTRLLPASANSTGAVITIYGGQDLTIESLAVEGFVRGRGIDAQGRNPFSKVEQKALGPITGLTLQQLEVSSGFYAPVRIEHARKVTVVDCTIQMSDSTSLEHALVVGADDVRIEHNVVQVPAPGATAFFSDVGTFLPGTQALGGIHIEGLSDRVRIIDNLIRGGSGNGITLGSVVWYFEGGDPVPPEDEPDPKDPDPCDPAHPFDIGIILIFVLLGELGQIHQGSAGPLYDVRIERNRIYSMGGNGISVVKFFDLSKKDEFVTVVDLSILGNEIRHCLQRPVAPPPAELVGFMGYGGIVLADVENLVVHDNTIVDNGLDWLDPVCGVFVLHGEGVDLMRNRIVNTGARTNQPVTGGRPGQRGGVVIRYALPPSVIVTLSATTTSAVPAAPMQNGVPAVRLQDNIVSQPLGRALTVFALGPVSVEANQLTSQAIPSFSVDWSGMMAGAVLIMNLGFSNELYLQTLLFAALNKGKNYLTGAIDASARSGLDDATLGRLLANGQVLFNDNQVNLDLIAVGASFSASSILIMTMDDLSFSDNQCEANLRDDLLLSNAMLFAMSLRAESNRWKEGLFNAPLSALTIGLMMNTTIANQGTHCIVVRGWPPLLVDEGNTVLIEGILQVLLGSKYPDRGFCRAGFSKFLPAMTKPDGNNQ